MASLLPDRLYMVGVRSAPAPASSLRCLGFKSSIFGFREYHLALHATEFLNGHVPDVFYTHVRANAFRVRWRTARPLPPCEHRPEHGYGYEIECIARDDYCDRILENNLSIRVIDNVDRESDIPELVVVSSLKIDPRLRDHRAFLERLMNI